ncbi:MAG: hypothetical protein A2Y03_07265 [Omnitrophica WOR_2 bacterium GWF2_38_59]|nr:MAG: hypothetical protein A2Y03_07265 [Omnitrophica WOR_2 bacterium GWF2_38_59]OGX48882.1 MAG: hypothetical protein A2243_07675 [Omnitrophica WOR_2 bacterium RIFOXYA2_FULL_38_17]OGX52564.1 MAG: hypothetical protein A2267_07985 [Omnitrophica WOR_2 bacterium RIFOXYA12_FULL_38_10]OGX56856.1 MAG: hypothetical protein A2306_05485 [Omnitrophica WOR_2 bacterium RIFOXYB2_FULL_38_16]OGX57611.1 MAG: hypothetical protein A2447_00620 [Omnitrophica WOR_2 bacterium RIFOXYC2_FULL_38_12]HBG60798.1 N-acetyl
MTTKKYFAHKSSCIDKGSKIGEGTAIWHFCHIFKGATIGKNCKLGQNVVVHSTAILKNNVKIQNNVSVYDGVTLENDVFCGPSCVFTNIINPRAAICRNSAEHYRKTLVKRGSSIGANATIICGVTIGENAFIGAGSVVTKDVGDYELVYGSPARRHGWMCQCGNKLTFKKGSTTCVECKLSYKKDNNIVIKS